MRTGAADLNSPNGEMIHPARFVRELSSNQEGFRRLSSNFGPNWIGRADGHHQNHSPHQICLPLCGSMMRAPEVWELLLMVETRIFSHRQGLIEQKRRSRRMAEVTTIQIRGEDRTAAAFRSANKGLDRLERNLQAANAKTATLTAGLGRLGGVMAGLVGVGALGAFTTSIIQLGDRLPKGFRPNRIHGRRT